MQEGAPEPEVDPARRAEIERLAMAAVIAAEEALGFVPRDVSRDNCGYDIESRRPDGQGHLRFVEVKGRAAELLSLARAALIRGAPWELVGCLGAPMVETSAGEA